MKAKLRAGGATREVDYDSDHLFPDGFREPQYWIRLLQCVGLHPNVLSGVTLLRLRKENTLLTEITITLPLFLGMRLCAAGFSMAGQNRRELIPGLASFTPREQDCIRVQRAANAFLTYYRKLRGWERSFDEGPALSLASDGLFNVRRSGSSSACGSNKTPELPAGSQGMTVYVTSLPTNLHSGTQAQDDELEVHYGRDMRNLLCPSHPVHINDAENWWRRPLRDLIRDPPTYGPWLQSYVFRQS